RHPTRLRGLLRKRAFPASLAGRPAARDSPRRWNQYGSPAGSRGRRDDRRHLRDRQSHQGHRRCCRPVSQPDERMGRDRRPADHRGVLNPAASSTAEEQAQHNNPLEKVEEEHAVSAQPEHHSPQAGHRTGVTAPAGFRAAGVTAGIKPSGNPDMALIVNDGPDYHAAALFTRNQIKAAPVQLTKSLHNGTFRAAVVNAGNANACTGEQGMADAKRTGELVGNALGIDAADVAVCSTGLIGDLLPMDKIEAGVEALASELSTDLEAGTKAAEAIMTTDTVIKQAVYEGDGWSIGAMAKGVGMMAPSLATMLVFLT